METLTAKVIVTYTTEQINKAFERIQHIRDVDKAKYQRNKVNRNIYGRAYYEDHKEAVLEKKRIEYALKHPKKSKKQPTASILTETPA